MQYIIIQLDYTLDYILLMVTGLTVVPMFESVPPMTYVAHRKYTFFRLNNTTQTCITYDIIKKIQCPFITYHTLAIYQRA